ncbi:MAG: hypothetical protein JJU46_05155, partial [Balneolaceae bacterium]|nr:hypothetical protein [Balneolaceae bacterium]
MKEGLGADITHVIFLPEIKYDVAQRFNALGKILVHFGLIQNEPKDQGGESLGGGCFWVTEKFQG